MFFCATGTLATLPMKILNTFKKYFKLNNSHEKYYLNSMNTDLQINSTILSATDENIQKCAEYILSGGIVGMPTETVYGLAANAFDTIAVQKIFQYKGRPLTDPLIVHVSSFEMAADLINVDPETYKIFHLLAKQFWPGPLTVVLKANFNKLSPILTANTEYIGLRFPNNEIATKLINFSGVPIAAPSANKFCHVSPVNPVHVMDDFKEFPVMILDGGVCNFCMESTVIKITTGNIQILRPGAISPDELSNFIKESGVSYKIEIVKKLIPVTETAIKQIDTKENEFEINQECPGQFIKHYSPQIDTFIFDPSVYKTGLYNPKEIVIIDYKEILQTFCCSAIPTENIFQLSKEGDANEVMKNLYDFLRKAENVAGAKIILLCDIEKHMKENFHKSTLVDRMNKAAAFRRININI